MLLWFTLLSRLWFGSKRFDSESETSFDLLKVKEDSVAKYYIYLIPIFLFAMALAINLWAKLKYIGVNDEYSIAYGFLSGLIPIK